MTLREAIAAARTRLVAAGIEPGEATRDASLLARHVLGWDRATLVTRDSDAASGDFTLAFEQAIERRARREPVAYIRAVQEFWGREFLVSPSVLIPRPETELIIEEVQARLPQPPRRIADIGTGSGCLAVSVALEWPQATVVATDVSIDALTVARENAARLGATERITFLETPYLFGTTGTFDAILSNPPYITDAEYEALQPEVREYEPAMALTAGEDGLRDIRQIIDLAPSRLAVGGLLLIEVGHLQSDAVADIINEYRTLELVTFRTDLQDIPRIAVITRTHDR